MGKVIDLTGQRFERLTVIERRGRRGSRALWLCVCDCGNEITIDSNSLRTGNTRSCGCIRKEHSKRIGSANKMHGMFGTRLYMIWADIKRRCTNPNCDTYHYYGGRGITVCEDWKNNFQTFYDWAIAAGYRDDLTIDRIDTNGDYCPDNCKWSTWEEQENNRRNNRLVTYDGKTQTISQWAREYNIPYITLIKRLNSPDWNIEKALTTK